MGEEDKDMEDKDLEEKEEIGIQGQDLIIDKEEEIIDNKEKVDILRKG